MRNVDGWQVHHRLPIYNDIPEQTELSQHAKSMKKSKADKQSILWENMLWQFEKYSKVIQTNLRMDRRKCILNGCEGRH